MDRFPIGFLLGILVTIPFPRRVSTEAGLFVSFKFSGPSVSVRVRDYMAVNLLVGVVVSSGPWSESLDSTALRIPSQSQHLLILIRARVRCASCGAHFSCTVQLCPPNSIRVGSLSLPKLLRKHLHHDSLRQLHILAVRLYHPRWHSISLVDSSPRGPRRVASINSIELPLTLCPLLL